MKNFSYIYYVNKLKLKSMKSQFEIWLEKVNEKRKKYWDANYDYKEYEPLSVSKGKKYMKIIDGSSVWKICFYV